MGGFNCRATLNHALITKWLTEKSYSRLEDTGILCPKLKL